MPKRIIFLVLLAAPLVYADEKADAVFRVYDANGDGVLTPGEVPDASIFAKADANKDGKITKEEVAAYLGTGAKPRPAVRKKPGTKTDAGVRRAPRTTKERVADFFRRFDRNKDRKIQRAEFQGDDETFRRYDRSRDKKWNSREVTRYVAETVRMAKRRPRPDNFFDLFDRNRDKKVTSREYDGPSDFFRRYDHNKDRTVTEEELNMGPNAGRMMRGDEKLMADGPTPAPKRGLLERYDKNKDGRITLKELNDAESILHRLDKNRDGVLSGSEVK